MTILMISKCTFCGMEYAHSAVHPLPLWLQNAVVAPARILVSRCSLPPPLRPRPPPACFLSAHLPVLDISHLWDHTVGGLLCPAAHVAGCSGFSCAVCVKGLVPFMAE